MILISNNNQFAVAGNQKWRLIATFAYRVCLSPSLFFANKYFFLSYVLVCFIYFSNSLSLVQVTEKFFWLLSLNDTECWYLFCEKLISKRDKLVSNVISVLLCFSTFSDFFSALLSPLLFTSKNYLISIFLMYRLLFLLLVFFISFTSIFFWLFRNPWRDVEAYHRRLHSLYRLQFTSGGFPRSTSAVQWTLIVIKFLNSPL